jgi:myo-inositol-1(or 4)-monophosphatase
MLKIAKLAAEEAGKILLRHYGKVSTDSIRSKQANDFMSFVDEASEEKIISIIKKKYPSHNILAEESGLEQQKSDWQWIVDPLDGTTNFLKQIPAFCISIALAYKKKMALGVIYDPLKNELFSAENGKGAYLNHKPIAVSTQPSVEKAFVATGFPFKFKDMMPQFQNLFYDIFIKTMGMRRMGAAALDLAYTACGRFDGIINHFNGFFRFFILFFYENIIVVYALIKQNAVIIQITLLNFLFMFVINSGGFLIGIYHFRVHFFLSVNFSQ